MIRSRGPQPSATYPRFGLTETPLSSLDSFVMLPDAGAVEGSFDPILVRDPCRAPRFATPG